MRISDWSSDVCSSDLTLAALAHAEGGAVHGQAHGVGKGAIAVGEHRDGRAGIGILAPGAHHEGVVDRGADDLVDTLGFEILSLVDEAGEMLRRSEEHTSELQSLMRISYAVFCL